MIQGKERKSRKTIENVAVCFLWGLFPLLSICHPPYFWAGHQQQREPLCMRTTFWVAEADEKMGAR
jgi:hypothetical protein